MGCEADNHTQRGEHEWAHSTRRWHGHTIDHRGHIQRLLGMPRNVRNREQRGPVRVLPLQVCERRRLQQVVEHDRLLCDRNRTQV